jgi:hypothetical protein
MYEYIAGVVSEDGNEKLAIEWFESDLCYVVRSWRRNPEPEKYLGIWQLQPDRTFESPSYVEAVDAYNLRKQELHLRDLYLKTARELDHIASR